jgi:hypothetical protein
MRSIWYRNLKKIRIKGKSSFFIYILNRCPNVNLTRNIRAPAKIKTKRNSFLCVRSIVVPLPYPGLWLRCCGYGQRSSHRHFRKSQTVKKNWKKLKVVDRICFTGSSSLYLFFFVHFFYFPTQFPSDTKSSTFDLVSLKIIEI